MENVIPKKQMLHDIKCQYGTDWDNLEAEIRADERAKLVGKIITDGETLNNIKKEAYAKGQAELIEEIKTLENPYPKDVFVSKKYEAWRRAWDICMESVLAKASESLGAIKIQ